MDNTSGFSYSNPCNYFERVKSVNPEKTALIEDGTVYTYGKLKDMAAKRAEEIRKYLSEPDKSFKHKLKFNSSGKQAVYIIQEKCILNQLVLFLACNAAGIIPVIAPYDVKLFPEITDVPEHICMAVMTSGTTGVPKILYRTYQSWADFFPVQNRIFGINKDSILFAQGSLAFTGNMNLYMAQFYAGGTIIAENKFNPKRWAYVIEKENVDTIYLIPSKLKLLTDIIKTPCNNIKSVLSGSQSLGREDAKKLKKIFPNADIILYYGASELSYITYVKDKDMISDKNLIGKPFPGVEVFIHNGRIYASSNFHAEGIKCPYALPDNGHMDEDGRLYFDGRSDDIVIIRGRKVSLTHIENELEKFEEIHEAAVIFAEENEKERLIAFASTLKNTRNTNDILCGLRQSLASYEMPSKLIILDKMFYNESGKKDKKKLWKFYKNNISFI